jgi:serine/threonine protein kinase
VLKAVRTCGELVQQRAVLLMPKPWDVEGSNAPPPLISDEQVRSLERATALSAVSSPSLLAIDSSYGIATDRTLGYRFMELLDDEVTTMADEGAGGGDNAPDDGAAATDTAKRCYHAVKYGLRLLAALRPLHERQLVHTALAPKHVVRVGSRSPADVAGVHAAGAEGGAEYELKLIGLGALHLAGEPSHAQLVEGVAAYASPEVRIKGRPVDGRADLYSVGMVLFEAVSGEVPNVGLEDSLPPDLMAAREGVDQHLNDVISRALHPLPGSRFKSAEDMGRALQDCAAQQGDTWYHVFLSYRVHSDARLVRKVYEQLRRRELHDGSRIRVYLDSESGSTAGAMDAATRDADGGT